MKVGPFFGRGEGERGGTGEKDTYIKKERERDNLPRSGKLFLRLGVEREREAELDLEPCKGRVPTHISKFNTKN